MIRANLRYTYLATLADWSEIETILLSSSASGAAKLKRDIDLLVDKRLTELSDEQWDCIYALAKADQQEESKSNEVKPMTTEKEEVNKLIKRYRLDPAFTALCKMEECESCKGTGKGEEYDLPHSHCLSCNGKGYDWIPL